MGDFVKRRVELKYPNSAELFKFCRLILDKKYGGLRIIDQDIGQLLNFDPADCSHWKKGKKNIHSIHAIKDVSNHLGVDEKVIVDILCGETTATEAFCEFIDNNLTVLSTQITEQFKKEYYRQNSYRWDHKKESDLKKIFYIDKNMISNKVSEIHEKINFNEPPLYLPEIMTHYPDLLYEPKKTASNISEFDVTKRINKNKWIISYTLGSEVRPYTRLQIAKASALYFLPKKIFSKEFEPFKEEIQRTESNLFASLLLTPEHLIRKVLGRVNHKKDLLAQIASEFWVSKTFMNKRLQQVFSATDTHET